MRTPVSQIASSPVLSFVFLFSLGRKERIATYIVPSTPSSSALLSFHIRLSFVFAAFRWRTARTHMFTRGEVSAYAQRLFCSEQFNA